MKITRVLYYFLFLGVVMGTFASMAQNSYGLVLISTCCFLFSVLFLMQAYFTRNKQWINRIELIGLGLLTTLFGLRASYIHIPYIEWVVIGVCVLLAVIYGLTLKNNLTLLAENRTLLMFTSLFYGGLMLLLISMSIKIFIPLVSDMLGGAGFGLLVLFGLGHILKGKTLFDGNEITLMNFIRKQKPRAMVLGTAFFLISIYAGLYMVGIAPPLYTDKVPPTYLELVRVAEDGQEKPVNGSFEHDRFKEAYDAFVEKNK